MLERGADALLAVAAARCGLKVSIMRIVQWNDYRENIVCLAQRTLPSLKTVGKLYGRGNGKDTSHSPAHCMYVAGIVEDDADVSLEEVTWVVSLPDISNGSVHTNIPTA